MMTRVLLAAAVLAAPAPRAQEREISVWARRQLFIDHKFIESAEGVSLVMNAPQRTGEVLLQADAAWEKRLRVGSYGTVAVEDGRVRLWYQVSGRENPPGKNPDFLGVAYAESADGIHFRKPILGLEFEGSRQINLVLPADPRLLSIGGGSVWRDDNPACPPQERYKNWQKVYPEPGTGIFGPHRIRVSRDGLHWQLPEKRVAGLRAADTQPAWFRDPRLGRYVRYSREWVQFEGEGKIRMASCNESADIHDWQGMFISLQPDEWDFAAALRPQLDAARMRVQGEVWVPAEQKEPTAGDREAAPDQDQAPMPGAPVDIYGPEVFPYTEADGVYAALLSAFHNWERRDGGS